MVVGAGSFGTAVAVLLARGGMRTTLQTRTPEQAGRLAEDREPAHAHETVSEGAGLIAASTEEALATALAGVFIRAGVVCEESNDPIGVERAGVAKNAAALASGATEAQGLNAAGAAAGHIFAEMWRWAETLGARPESVIGLAGTGDLVCDWWRPAIRLGWWQRFTAAIRRTFTRGSRRGQTADEHSSVTASFTYSRRSYAVIPGRSRR